MTGRLRAGAAALTATLVTLTLAPSLASATTPAPVAGPRTEIAASTSSSPPKVVDSQSVQVDAKPSGSISSAYLFTQVAATGHGTTTVDTQTATDGLRDLDGFSKPSVSNGRATWHLDVDGTARRRTVANFATSRLPVTLKASYTLDGKPIAASDIAGKTGVLRATYSVRNISGETEQVSYRNGAGKVVTAAMTVPVPLIGQIQTILPSSFTQITAPNASLSGDGHGATIATYQMVLFPPMGSTTQTLGYEATLTNSTLPAVQMQVVAAAPKTVPSLRWAEGSISSGAATSRQISSGGTQLDTGLSKLAAGSSKLLTGLGKLSSGATQLHTGLATAGTGTQKLSAGADQLAAGTATLSSGLHTLAAGEKQALAGQKQALAGASIGFLGLQTGSASLLSKTRQLVTSLKSLETEASSSSASPALVSGLTSAVTAAEAIATGISSSGSAASGLSSLLLPGLKKLVAGQGKLSAGASKAAAGAKKIASGSSQLAAGGHQLADGLPAAVSGSGQIATGLGQAGAGDKKIRNGLGQARSQGTSKLIAGGNSSAVVYGKQAAILAAMDVRATTSATPYPVPAGVTGNAAYIFSLAAATHSSTDNAVRGVVALVILAITSVGGWLARRRWTTA